MAPSGDKSKRFTTDSQAQVEQAAHQAGIAGAFGEAANLGPQVVELQRALLGGIVRSQRREADRLAGLYAKDDPRIARAVQRTQQLQEAHAQVDGHAAQVARFVETFRRAGMFSGYVIQADGTPAEAHTVRVEIADHTQKRTRRGSAKTDTTGYFSIALSGTDQAGTQDIDSGLQRFVERLLQAMPADGAAPEDDDAPASAEASGMAPASSGMPSDVKVSSRVEVLEPSGRVVFEDPIPPTLDVVASEFRYYVLTQQGEAPVGGMKRKRR